MSLPNTPQRPESSQDGVQANVRPEPKNLGMKRNEVAYVESRAEDQFTRTSDAFTRTGDIQGHIEAHDTSYSSPANGKDAAFSPWVTAATAGGTSSVLYVFIDKTSGNVIVWGGVVAFVAWLIHKVAIEWLRRRP
jgi:hypothetical protein